MFGRSAREQAEYEKFHYPGTDVLRNRLGLRDASELEIAERHFWTERSRQVLPAAVRQFDVDGLKAIHRHHLRDVYDWAGEFRTYTTGRGAAPFATPENILPWLTRHFTGLHQEDVLKSLDTDRFALRAAVYVNEINAAHPFIEGNGRTQRVWLRLLAECAGHVLLLRSEDGARWYEASRIGFEMGDSAPMAALIRDGL